MDNEMFYHNERKEVQETSAPPSAPKKEEKPCFFVRVWNWIKNLFN
jgi:hypothetical protein